METKTSSEENGRFTLEVERALRQAGWYLGRALAESQLEQWYAFKYKSVPGYHQIIPSALVVLREFGGLLIEQDAPGVTCYRESFSIDPLTALGLKESSWHTYEWLLEESLFPLGVTGSSQDDILAITGSGKVLYMPNEGPLLLVGNTFAHALNSLIVGIMPLALHFEHYERKRREAAQVRAAVRRLYGTEWRLPS
jgi:SUKH-3 immunity protein